MRTKKLFTSAIALLTAVSLAVLSLVATAPFSPKAEAAGYGYYTPYNFSFNLHGNNRLIRTEADFQLLLQDILELLEDLQDRLADDLEDDNDDSDSEVDVVTRPATRIQDDHARIGGEVVDFNDSNYATVWFEYGRSNSFLNQETNSARIDDDEDGEFEGVISNLIEGQRYYFRAVASDDDGDEDRGSILHFTAGEEPDDDDDDNDGDTPDVFTDDADDVTEDSVTLTGSVDMNDFNDADVFFVYGEDEDLVEDVADDFDSYDDVDEESDDLQKVLVESNFDDDDDFEADITGLDEDTDYFFSICVAYEDDGDDLIECGDVMEFTTDED